MSDTLLGTMDTAMKKDLLQSWETMTEPAEGGRKRELPWRQGSLGRPPPGTRKGLGTRAAACPLCVCAMPSSICFTGINSLILFFIKIRTVKINSFKQYCSPRSGTIISPFLRNIFRDFLIL